MNVMDDPQIDLRCIVLDLNDGSPNLAYNFFPFKVPSHSFTVRTRENKGQTNSAAAVSSFDHPAVVSLLHSEKNDLLE